MGEGTDERIARAHGVLRAHRAESAANSGAQPAVNQHKRLHRRCLDRHADSTHHHSRVAGENLTTAVTFSAGAVVPSSSAFTSIAPRSPRVRITFFAPRPSSDCAAALASSSVSTGMPVSISVSGSLGQIISWSIHLASEPWVCAGQGRRSLARQAG